MHSSYKSYSLDELKLRIKEIKKKNILLYKKFKKSELSKSSLQDVGRLVYKSNIIDDIEISAVEYCYKKALKLAEHCLKLKIAKKQRRNIKKLNETNNSFTNVLTSSPNKQFINKPKNMSNELIHLSESFKKPIMLKTTLDSSEFHKNSNYNNNLISTRLNEKNTSSDDIIFCPSECCLSDKKRKVEVCATQTLNRITFNDGIKKFKYSQKSELNKKNLPITSNFDKNENHDEVVKNSDIVFLKKIDPSHKLANKNHPFNESNAYLSTFPKHSASNLLKIPFATCKNFQCISVENNKEGTKNTLKNSVKFTVLEPDITKDPVEGINLIEDSDSTTELSLKEKNSETNILRGLNSAKKTDEEITSELDFLEEFSEKIIPMLDLTENPVDVIIPELDLTDEHDEAIIPELDLTQETFEAFIPDFDLTEEPVDFPVPRLHIDESTKYSSTKISFLKSEGIIIRSGTWSKEEEELLTRNFRNFQSRFGIYDARLLLGIRRMLTFYKHGNSQIKKFLKAKHFYIRLGKDLNDRTLHSIYYKARIMFDPFNQNKNITSRNIAAIVKLQKRYGNNWNLIGETLKIPPCNCKEIYYYHRKPINKGKWSESEVQNLISAIKSVANISDLNAEDLKGISWEKVAALVPTRNYIQCYDEWRNNQSKLFKNVSFAKWNKYHTAKLIFLLKSKYPVIVENDISWSEVQKFFKGVTHSEFALRTKWYNIKSQLPKKWKSNFPKMIDFCCKKYSKYINAIQ